MNTFEQVKIPLTRKFLLPTELIAAINEAAKQGLAIRLPIPNTSKSESFRVNVTKRLRVQGCPVATSIQDSHLLVWKKVLAIA